MPEEGATGAAGRAEPDADLRVKVTALLAEIAQTPEQEINTAWIPDYKPGVVVGRFELLRELGRGGFGVVYEARDRELGRLVAFKAVRPGTRARAAKRTQWLALEAEAAAQLNHENIVALHDVGRSDGGPYLIFELLEGQTLEQRLRAGILPVEAALEIALAVARALAWAHASGVIHRDLKPSNVFLTSRGGVKVLDFGLARVFGRASSEAGGTPAYMAPEQWRGAVEDERTDIYAFGVMLYEMFTGRVPFEVRDGRNAADAPVASFEAVPLGLRRLVRTAISADPAHRPRTIEAMSEVIEHVAERHRRRSRLRHRVLPALAAAVLALVVALVYVSWRSRGEGDAEERRGATFAVADFSNETQDPDLGALAGMLATSLEQSRRLELVTRSRLVDVSRQLGRHDVGMDEAAAREAAKNAGVGTLLSAEVRRDGALYALEVQGIDPVSGRQLFRMREQASDKERLVAAVDRLSQRIRDRLPRGGDSAPAGRASVSGFTTSSVEAYAHYFRAQQLCSVPDWGKALQEIGAALEIDPGFALAYWSRAYIGEFMGVPLEARRADALRALSLGDRLPRKERLLAEAWVAESSDDDTKATALYTQAVDGFPDDKDVLFLAADALHHAGKTAAAVELFTRALQIDPTWMPAAEHAVEDLARLKRYDEALEVARRAVEVSPVPASYALLSRAHEYRGEVDQAIDAAQRAVEAGGGVAAIQQLSDAFIWAGRLDDAERTANRMLAPTVAAAWRLEGYHQRVKVLGVQGRYREALRVLDSIPPPVQAANLAHHQEFRTDVLALVRYDPARLWLAAKGRRSAWIAAELAYAGDLADAATFADGVQDGSWRDLYEGVVAWRRGDLEDAATLLEDATLRRTRAEVLAHLYLGELLGDMGRDSEALEELAKFQAEPEMSSVRAFGYPRSLLYAARSQERLGMRAQALDNVNQLLELWRRADPDLPELSEARAMGARLVARGPRR